MTNVLLIRHSSASWEHQLKYRPRCPETLWLSCLSYHYGPLNTLHDIGTGTGLAASTVIRVARTQGHNIKHAYISDPDGASLALAERLLMAQTDFNKISFGLHLNRAEDSFLAPGSVDLATASECMHLTAFETDAAMDSIAASLRPGGTFVAVFHHLVGIVEGNERAAAALWRVQVERHAELLGEETTDSPPDRWRALMNGALGLDFVRFDPAKWADVRRMYVNVDRDRNKKPVWPWAETVWDSSVSPPESRVDVEREKVQVVMEPGWDVRLCTVEWVRHCLVSSKMGFGERTWESDAWREFERAVEQRGGRFYLRMPAMVVLARRR